MKISNQQLSVLDFIKRYIAEKNYSPTVREIMEGLGFKSPSSVHYQLKRLVDLNMISYSPAKSRTIELLVENEYKNEFIEAIEIEGLNCQNFIISDYIIENGKNIKDSLRAFKEQEIIYIINTSIEKSDSLALYKKDDCYKLATETIGEYIGTVVGKYENILF